MISFVLRHKDTKNLSNLNQSLVQYFVIMCFFVVVEVPEEAETLLWGRDFLARRKQVESPPKGDLPHAPWSEARCSVEERPMLHGV
jgi:hypothetical protein